MEHGDAKNNNKYAQQGQRVRVHGDVRPEVETDGGENVREGDGKQSLTEKFVDRVPRVGVVQRGGDAESIERIGFDLFRDERKRKQGENDPADEVK